MALRILWLDDDPQEIAPCSQALQQRGHEVVQVRTVSDAVRIIGEETFDLFILDIMVETFPLEEEGDFPVSQTKLGYDTGLVLFEKLKDELTGAKTVVIVLSLRTDAKIVSDFVAAGMPRSCVLRKRDTMSDVRKFITVIENLSQSQPES